MSTSDALTTCHDDIAADQRRVPPAIAANDPETDIEVLRTIPKQFRIDSHESANWLVRKVMASRSYAISVKEWCERELARADREEHTLMFLFGRQLEDWAKAEVAKLNGRRKSIGLPAGTVGFRSIPTALQVDNESQVIEWCKRNLTPAVVIVEKLSRAVLKEHFEKTGEAPENGAHVETSVEKLFIR